MWTKGWTGVGEHFLCFSLYCHFVSLVYFQTLKKWNVNLFSFPYPPSFNTVIFQRHWKMTRLLILGLRLLDVTDLIPCELWKTRDVKTCKWGEGMKNPHSKLSFLLPSLNPCPTSYSPASTLSPQSYSVIEHLEILWKPHLCFVECIWGLGGSRPGEVLIAFTGPLLR